MILKFKSILEQIFKFLTFTCPWHLGVMKIFCMGLAWAFAPYPTSQCRYVDVSSDDCILWPLSLSPDGYNITIVFVMYLAILLKCTFMYSPGKYNFKSLDQDLYAMTINACWAMYLQDIRKGYVTQLHLTLVHNVLGNVCSIGSNSRNLPKNLKILNFKNIGVPTKILDFQDFRIWGSNYFSFQTKFKFKTDMKVVYHFNT